MKDRGIGILSVLSDCDLKRGTSSEDPIFGIFLNQEYSSFGKIPILGTFDRSTIWFYS